MTRQRRKGAATACVVTLLWAAGGLPLNVTSPGDRGLLGLVEAPLRTIQSQAFAQAQTTPSHVFQMTGTLIAEVELLREAIGATDYPLEAERVNDRQPLHTYTRSLEVRRKIAAAQQRLGIPPAQVGQVPVKTISPADVFSSVELALAEVRRTKAALFVEDQVDPVPFVGGKTPSHVYQLMGDASFLLDGLVGRPTNINDVYANLLQLQEDIELIAARLGVGLELDPPAIDNRRKRLTEVAQQVLRAMFKIVRLQAELGMNASVVPRMTLVRLVPANVYEAINLMQAEIVRIKVALGIEIPAAEVAVSRNTTPRDVFAQTLLLIRNLDALLRAADGSGRSARSARR